ncbi:MAG: YbaK/EbsC family protein [Acidobacteriota bacterium]
MPWSQVKQFLDENQVPYVTISHSPAYTAQGIAAAAHVKGKELAKVVMIKVDGRLAMAVLPAPYKVNFDKLREAIGCREVTLAAEEEFGHLFPDCELGAMPPFGNLYGLDVYVAKSLTEDEEIAFNAGTHSELIRMAYKDFERLVKPKVLSFTTHGAPTA